MHHRSKKNPVPRSDPPAAHRPHRQRVHLVANGHAGLCPTCDVRDCAHMAGHADTMEAARVLLGGADGAVCRDRQGRWWAYTA